MIHKILRKQFSSNDCFVCGIKNDSGIKASFYEVEGNELITTFKTKPCHQSYPGRTHGGVIAAMLDEAIGRSINITEPDTFGVTINLNISYRKPVPYDEDLKIVSRLTKNTSKWFEAEGEIINKDGEVLSNCKGVYVKMPKTEIVSGIAEEEIDKMMFKYLGENEPQEFDY